MSYQKPLVENQLKKAKVPFEERKAYFDFSKRLMYFRVKRTQRVTYEWIMAHEHFPDLVNKFELCLGFDSWSRFSLEAFGKDVTELTELL